MRWLSEPGARNARSARRRHDGRRHAGLAGAALVGEGGWRDGLRSQRALREEEQSVIGHVATRRADESDARGSELREVRVDGTDGVGASAFEAGRPGPRVCIFSGDQNRPEYRIQARSPFSLGSRDC